MSKYFKSELDLPHSLVPQTLLHLMFHVNLTQPSLAVLGVGLNLCLALVADFVLVSYLLFFIV